MENKYYTPKIEEFHIGFEFETKSTAISHNEDGTAKEMIWEKDVIDILDLSGKTSNYDYQNNFDDVIDYLKDGLVRVKYLDKEDIESLLGKEIKENEWHIDRKFRMVFSEQNLKNNLYLELFSNDDFYFSCFSFTIKNKSELKKLLKQLGIIE